MKPTLDCIPPNNLEAEQSVLGSMMLTTEALHKGLSALSHGDFYRPVHEEVYDALSVMAARKEPVDVITLQEELRSRGKLEDSGGTEYLMALVNSVPTAANVEYYAKIVVDKAKRRAMISAGTEVIAAAYDEDTESPEDLLMQRAVGLSTRSTGRVRNAAELVNAGWERLEAYHRGERREGIPFGISNLDALTYGCCDGELVIIGGRPSQGKSILLAHLLLGAAKKGVVPLLFSQEMTADDLVERLFHMEARVDMNRSRMGRLDTEEADGEWGRLASAANDLLALRFLIDDMPCPITKLCARARAAKITDGVGIVLVDYLQLIECDIKHTNRDDEVEKVTKQLKQLAVELGIPVVVPSQLSRGIERRDDKVPVLADLRDGGNQEGHADKVILIDNPLPKEIARGDKLEARRAKLFVAKHRGGRTGMADVWFTPYWTRFDASTGGDDEAD